MHRVFSVIRSVLAWLVEDGPRPDERDLAAHEAGLRSALLHP
jgi:hypothetical protein